MPGGSRSTAVALLLLYLLVPAGVVGALQTEEAGPHEAIEAMVAPSPGEEPGTGPSLERLDVEARQDPLLVGGTVAIRAVVDPGEVEGPVDLEVIVDHAEGETRLSPAPVPAEPHRPVLIATYWDAEAVGPYEVQGMVILGGEELTLPSEQGQVVAAQTGDSSKGWVAYLVEGTLMWALVLGGLAWASRWAKQLDQGDD